MIENFAVLIISHGRASTVVTDLTIRKHGYTGPIYYVIDNEDSQADAYIEKYGDAVRIFDKKAYADLVDEGDNFDNRRCTTHARNACFDIAEALGFEWFLVLDDDYTAFDFRTTAEGNYPRQNLSMGEQLDGVLSAILEFYKSVPALSVAMAQGGDFLGGADSTCSSVRTGRPMRKVMNTFFCATSRRFWFRGRNEDVTTYVAEGFTGSLFITIPLVSITQKQTQTNAGGMSDAYVEAGTYVKSFYSLMNALGKDLDDGRDE